MTTETKSVAQQLVDIIMPSDESARSEAVIRIEAALEAAEREGAEKEREECAALADDLATEFEKSCERACVENDTIVADTALAMERGATRVANEIRKRGAK